MESNKIPREEHPNPQFFREEWINLNGEWQFEIDSYNGGKESAEKDKDAQPQKGRNEEFIDQKEYSQKITVPFCPESELSGINNKGFMECVWYKRTFTLPESYKEKRTILHIGACDYKTEVWINGKSAGCHIGGYVSFSIDITDFLEKENTIVICAEDRLLDNIQPSGKQSKQEKSYQCFYTRTTGIWQTVWLESVPNSYIEKVKYTPDIENSRLLIEAICKNSHGMKITASAEFCGKNEAEASATVTGSHAVIILKLSELYLWEPGNPSLYDLEFSLGEDKVKSYFGMRSIAFDDYKFYINGKSVFQRLVLDQGFYPDGIYTAKDDNTLKRDIELSMQMGFNGARLHQKVFEPRFLYYCDKMGYIVWGEHGNWGLDLNRPDAFKGFIPEWMEILARDYNHPAIVGWCPFNETGGGQDNELIKAVYSMTKIYDPIRPVIDCSGWAHVITDIWDWHDYDQRPEFLKELYAPLAEGKAPLNEIWGISRENAPKISFISEYGGIKWTVDEEGGESWGYGEGPQTEEEFIERFRGLSEALMSNPRLFGFCYTQLTDVEQEQNGLYTYKRKAKFDPGRIKEILQQKAAIE